MPKDNSKNLMRAHMNALYHYTECKLAAQLQHQMKRSSDGDETDDDDDMRVTIYVRSMPSVRLQLSANVI